MVYSRLIDVYGNRAAYSKGQRLTWRADWKYTHAHASWTGCCLGRDRCCQLMYKLRTIPSE